MKVAAAIAATLAFAALPVIVLAHAELVTSDPAAGATITTPYTLTASFAEDIDPEASTLIVQDASGVQVASGAIVFDDPTSMVAELPALPDGVYTVLWTTVTPDDGGVERGTYTFSVGSASASVTPAPTPPPGDGATGSGNDLVIALVLAAIAIVGVLAFVFVRGRR